jgi:hypothetical protein
MNHGSLNNEMVVSAADKPVVGMGATRIDWTDRHPFTVVEVLSDRRVVVQEDSYQRIDSNGMSENQSYEFTRNPEGEKVVISRRNNGVWRKVGATKTDKFVIGSRDKYHDYSF